MSKKQDRIVYRRPDGKWANQRNDSGKASSVHNTQKDAYAEAKRLLQRQGGGEISIQGVDGRIRNKNTISPGNDPCPPKDTKH